MMEEEIIFGMEIIFDRPRMHDIGNYLGYARKSVYVTIESVGY